MTRIPRSVLEHFRQVPLFSSVSQRDLRTIVMAAEEFSISAGTTMVREGERGSDLFVIVAGTAKVMRRGRKIGDLGSGDFFGEIALLSGGPRMATVTATSDVSLMMLGNDAFLGVLSSEPRVLRAVMAALGERLPTVQN